MDIAKYIKELVIRNECIVLPDFGGFETHYQPAFHNKPTGNFVPPSKQIMFKPEFKTDNGVLVNYIMDREKISQNESREIVHDYIQNIISEIYANGFFIIEDFGKLIKSAEGNLEFFAIEKENFLLDSFGLSEIKLPETDSKNEVIKIEEEPLQPEKQKRSYRKLVLSSVAVVIIAGIILLFFKFDFIDKIDSLLQNKLGAKDNPANKIVFGHRRTINYRDTATGMINEKLNERTEKEKALFYKEEKATPSKVFKVLNPSDFGSDKRYVIVAGSFNKESSALELKNLLDNQGYKPMILKTENGLFRVVLDSFEEINDAIEKLKLYKKDLDNSVWILRI